VPGRGVDDLAPDGAGLNPGDPRVRVDGDPPHPGRLDQDGVLERAERPRVVAGALRGDPQAAGAGEADDAGDVIRRPGQGDGGGVLVHGQVPGLAGIIPAGIAGHDDGRGHHSGHRVGPYDEAMKSCSTLRIGAPRQIRP